jgi:hypothetical protein
MTVTYTPENIFMIAQLLVIINNIPNVSIPLIFGVVVLILIAQKIQIMRKHVQNNAIFAVKPILIMTKKLF